MTIEKTTDITLRWKCGLYIDKNAFYCLSNKIRLENVMRIRREKNGHICK